MDKITFDQLSEADYENLLSQMGTSDPTNFYYRDTTEKNRLVMNKAFRVSGVTVTADYTPDQLKDLKGKYPNGGSVNVGGDKGATITFGYSSVSSLTLKASGEIYIAGEFAKLQGGHVALAGNANAVKYKMIPVDARNVVIGTPDDAHSMRTSPFVTAAILIFVCSSARPAVGKDVSTGLRVVLKS